MHYLFKKDIHNTFIKGGLISECTIIFCRSCLETRLYWKGKEGGTPKDETTSGVRGSKIKMMSSPLPTIACPKKQGSLLIYPYTHSEIKSPLKVTFSKKGTKMDEIFQ